MLLYCLNCLRNTESKNPKTFSSKCLVCNIKFRNFLKNKKIEDYGIILICQKLLEWIVFDKIFKNKVFKTAPGFYMVLKGRYKKQRKSPEI